MTLLIDTTEHEQVTFGLKDGKQLTVKTYATGMHKSHLTLKKLEEFLKKFRNPKSEIRKVTVCSGPGSFVGTRVGASIAQGLGLSWGAKVEFLEKEKFRKKLGI